MENIDYKEQNKEVYSGSNQLTDNVNYNDSCSSRAVVNTNWSESVLVTSLICDANGDANKMDNNDNDDVAGTNVLGVSSETSSFCESFNEEKHNVLTEGATNKSCLSDANAPTSAAREVSHKGVPNLSKSTELSEQNGSSSSLRKSTRSRKRSLPSESHYICPNCGLSLKPSDIENHLQVEINKLEKLTRHRRSYDPLKKQKTTTGSCSESSEIADCHSRYKKYLAVRTRREKRNKAKKRVKRPGDEQTTCPVCNDTIVGTPDELAEHVDLCLQQQEVNSDGELDIEGEGNFEEYTWAGQTRVRASSLLDGGLAASGFAVAKQNCEDEDMELDIDGDDSNMYGKSLYTEADLIPCNDAEDKEEKERQALRKAVLRAEGCKQQGHLPADRQRWLQNNDTCVVKQTVNDTDTDREDSTSQSEVIESLKAKLKDQEVQLQKVERPKCLICMDWYTKPLTSIQCWHVHCEECWLRTLGTKKLCPQCNMITSPADLRRIYL